AGQRRSLPADQLANVFQPIRRSLSGRPRLLVVELYPCGNEPCPWMLIIESHYPVVGGGDEVIDQELIVGRPRYPLERAAQVVAKQPGYASLKRRQTGDGRDP